jgi:hypothetical protein
MVKELQVEEPRPQQNWEKETGLWWELVYAGIPLPDDATELLRERYNFLPFDRDPAAVIAEKQWDAYAAWVEGQGKDDSRTPGQRLGDYFHER